MWSAISRWLNPATFNTRFISLPLRKVSSSSWMAFVVCWLDIIIPLLVLKSVLLVITGTKIILHSTANSVCAYLGALYRVYVVADGTFWRETLKSGHLWSLWSTGHHLPYPENCLGAPSEHLFRAFSSAWWRTWGWTFGLLNYPKWWLKVQLSNSPYTYTSWTLCWSSIILTVESVPDFLKVLVVFQHAVDSRSANAMTLAYRNCLNRWELLRQCIQPRTLIVRNGSKYWHYWLLLQALNKSVSILP